MRFSRFRLFASALLVMSALSVTSASAQMAESPYKVLKKAKVGGAGGFDYVFADSVGRKLYVPRSGGRAGGNVKSRVNVFDLDSLAPVGEIDDTIGVHGVAVDPISSHGFSSSNPVVMFDTKTLATIKTIPVQGNPDGILFEPATERIYVLSHRAPNVSVIDAKDGSVVGTIDLGGAPEQGQSDGNGRVYIDIEDKDNVAVVDANSMKVTGHYSLGDKGTGPAGLGLDVKNHVLFVFCRDPKVCVILDANDGKILTTLPIGNGTDGGGFNPNTMEAFSSQGDATLTIIKENSPTEFAVEQNVETMRGAKTCTVDLKTNAILLIAAEYGAPASAPATMTAPTTMAAGGPPQGRRGGGRGAMVPDSFTIIQVGK